MIPAKFEYLRPGSLADAVAALGADEDAAALAGGQSLIPLLRLRMTEPTTVVDLGALPELRGVRDTGGHLEIGALTSHYDLIADPLVAEHCGLLAMAARTVADPAVRHRGTLGGALAHADPAGDLPAAAVALDAEFLLAGPRGARTVPARAFFVDYLTTAIGEGEVLRAVRFAKFPAADGWAFHYEKLTRTAQSWAVVGVAAAVRTEGGAVGEARIGLTNMGAVPVRAGAAERDCRGTAAEEGALREAGRRADEGCDPPADLSARPDYRRHLARVLTGRALARAAGANRGVERR